MGILTRFFGYEGTVRFEAIEAGTGDKLVGKVRVECFNIDNEELVQELKNVFWVEQGIRVSSLKIIGMTRG